MKKAKLIAVLISLTIIFMGCSHKIANKDNLISTDIKGNNETEAVVKMPVNKDDVSVKGNILGKETSTLSVDQQDNEIILKLGDIGEKVTALQQKLYTSGIDLTIDGSYGKQTVEAVKKVQNANNLNESGEVDKKTDAAIKAMKNVREFPPPKQVIITASVPIQVNKPAIIMPQELTSIPDISTNVGDAQQVIVILASSYGTSHAAFKTYEKANGFWKLINNGNAAIGINGFSDNRHEGDLTSPSGKYGIPFLFGNAVNPGVKLPYRKVQTGDYWVSNKIIEEYNVWMHYDGTDVDARFYDYEKLWEQPLYKYAAVIDFNYGVGKVMGKGSGIFLHIAPVGGGGTEGCIGVSESNLVQILKWLDPGKKPVIVMGVKGRI